MRRRARRIRRSVAGLAATVFIGVFLVVYVQLASGHDPALVAAAARRRVATTSTDKSRKSPSAESGSTTESASRDESSGSEASSGSASSSGSEESSASAVTTSQS